MRNAADGVARRAVRLGAAAWLACIAAALAGCRDATGTGPDDQPGTLETLSTTSDQVPIGTILDRPLRVRVRSVSGAPLAGVGVRYHVLAGPGSLSPGASQVSVQSAADGSAQATFVGGATVGTATVQVDIPTAPTVTPVEFSIRTTGSQDIRLTAVSGDGQRAEVRTQLSLPFVVRASDSGDGSAAGGIRVEWSIALGGDGARLSAEFSYTAPDGTARTLLTVGGQAEEYTVKATSPGQTDTVTFRATATAGAEGGVVLESVAPLPLVPGSEATIAGSGFGSSPVVRVEGENATVVASSATSITFVTPGTGSCLPARTVGVRVLAGDAQSNGLIVDLVPGAGSLDLALGERRIVSGTGAGCLVFVDGAGEREYRVAVQSASTSSTAVTPFRLVLRSGPQAGAGPPTVALAPPPGGLAAIAAGAVFASDAELRIRRSARDALRVAGARPAADLSGGGALRLAAVPPQVGDRLQIDLAVGDDLSVSCTEPAAVIEAAVRVVGERFAILEDVANPTFFGSADLVQLRDELDDVVFAVDTAYFGGPADIDGNERVLVLFTRAVNELTPPGSGTFIGGFFVPTDLADDGQPGGGSGFGGDGICTTSNEGEILYVLAPDPSGEAGSAVDIESAKANARTVSSHEFHHLLSAEQRIFVGGGGFDDLEDTWLSEGLAHLAEEVVGLRAAGLSERANLSDAAFADTEAFNAFHINNFARLRQYFVAPNETIALARIDPGGFESLAMRGFAWIFVRWLGDHFGPAAPAGPLGGSGEHLLFRQLSGGGPNELRGVANVLRAVQVTGGGEPGWPELLGQFAIAPAVDDAGVPGVPATSTLTTWDLPGVFLELHQNPGSGFAFPEEYPLAVTARDFEPVALEFDVISSTEVYLQLADPSGPAFSLELLSPTGGPPPPVAAAQVTIVRTR